MELLKLFFYPGNTNAELYSEDFSGLMQNQSLARLLRHLETSSYSERS